MPVQRRNLLSLVSVHLFTDSGGNIAHIFRVDIHTMLINFPRINLPQVLKGVPAAYLMEGAPASFPTGLSKKSCLCS
jgi:hypothetical protein